MASFRAVSMARINLCLHVRRQGLAQPADKSHFAYSQRVGHLVLIDSGLSDFFSDLGVVHFVSCLSENAIAYSVDVCYT